MYFLQPLSAYAQQVRKTHSSPASKYDVFVLFKIDYSTLARILLS